MKEVNDHSKPNPRKDVVKLIATAAHPYLKKGEKFEVHPVHKEMLLERKWAVLDGEKQPSKKDMETAAVPLSHTQNGGKEITTDETEVAQP